MRENPQEHREGDILLDVGGMHCVNCAALVERKLAALPQVISVNVDRRAGRAVIGYRGELDMAALQGAVADDGYTLTLPDPLGRPRDAAAVRHTPRAYAEIAATFAILIGVVVILRQFALLPRGVSVSDTMTLGLAFVVGLVASVSSCIAVTGGLLVAIAAKYNAAHAHLTDLERLKPHIYFNAGRIVSYTLLGGAVGALGSALMLVAGSDRHPDAAGECCDDRARAADAGARPLACRSASGHAEVGDGPCSCRCLATGEGTAFLLGGLTFFLPCGFTQALQLYVLAKGDALTGAMTMLAFALGTLPALLSLSALSSFAKGAVRTHLLRFAGAAVILLGVLNVQYGLVLTGSDMNRAGGDGTGCGDRSEGAVHRRLRATANQHEDRRPRLSAEPVCGAAGCTGRVVDRRQRCGRLRPHPAGARTSHPEGSLRRQYDAHRLYTREAGRVRLQLRHGDDDARLQNHRSAQGPGIIGEAGGKRRQRVRRAP